MHAGSDPGGSIHGSFLRRSGSGNRGASRRQHRQEIAGVPPRRSPSPHRAPMDSFNARTWPACYVEWWFGDGAPGLDRERPMLFEQVARRLIDIEEHEYTLATDDVPYVASCQSRFNNPEIIAVLGDHRAAHAFSEAHARDRRGRPQSTGQVPSTSSLCW